MNETLINLLKQNRDEKTGEEQERRTIRYSYQ